MSRLLRPIIIGQKYFKLIPLDFSHLDKHHRKFYLFQCDCGKRIILQGSAVTGGNTKSCGCYVKESARNRALPNNLGQVRPLILRYKRHAKDRNIEYFLTEEEFSNLIRKPCFYCGIEFGNLFKNKNCKDGFKYNGIDRVDSKKPYIIDNCVPCCKQCNIAKMAMSNEDFLNWIKRVYEYSIKGDYAIVKVFAG